MGNNSKLKWQLLFKKNSPNMSRLKFICMCLDKGKWCFPRLTHSDKNQMCLVHFSRHSSYWWTSAGHITIHYLAALHSQTKPRVMCLGTQTQRPITTPSWHPRVFTLPLWRWGVEYVCVCLRVRFSVYLQSTDGSPLTFLPARGNQVRLLHRWTHWLSLCTNSEDLCSAGLM